MKNWIVADIDLSFSRKRHEPQTTSKLTAGNSTSPRTNGAELKKKLDTLQELLGVGLINKNEYEKKKESLLDQYIKAKD